MNGSRAVRCQGAQGTNRPDDGLPPQSGKIATKSLGNREGAAAAVKCQAATRNSRSG